VPCAAARTVEDMFDHEQVLAEDMIATMEHPQVGKYRGMKRSIHFGRTPGPEPFAAPAFGQDTDAVLSENGYSPREIAALREKRVIGE
jgi:crotonobetainyl-CoA:carnitine CoA-transferase CaiB-like acyl-CoA transferase